MRTLIIRPTLSYQGSNSQRKWKLPQPLRRDPLVAMTASCWSRRQGSQLVSAFCKSGGHGAGSWGAGVCVMVCHDDFLGIGGVGTALAPMELSLLSYSNPSRCIREKEQEARIFWWLGVHIDNKNYLGLGKRDTSLSQCLVWELLLTFS